MVQSVEEILFTLMSLIFLLIGVVIIASFFSSIASPSDQVAFANVEKLRAAINEVCVTGNSVTLDKFTLPQNTPAFGGSFSVVPMWLIRTNGDPNYVLYYESFPPGEAVGWELYQNFDSRVIVPLDAGDGTDALERGRDLVKLAGRPTDTVLINNVILSEEFNKEVHGLARFNVGEDEDEDERQTGKQRETDFFGLGEWDRNDLENDNKFEFTNYAALSPLEKSLIKYQPCGDNSLCLKTREGVFRFPLNHCGNIKDVQLFYDASGDDEKEAEIAAKLGVGTAATVGKGGFKAAIKFVVTKLPFAILKKSLSIFTTIPTIIQIGSFSDAMADMMVLQLSFKVGQFYSVSPCSLENVEIKKVSCDSEEATDTFLFGLASISTDICKDTVSHDIYSFNADENKLSRLGQHSVCIERIGQDIDPTEIGGGYGGGECIRIVVKEVLEGLNNNYCWTPDPFVRLDDDGSGKVLSFLFNHQEFKSQVIGPLGFTPVRDNTAFMSQIKAIVMSPSSFALNQGETWTETSGRRSWWGWG